MKIKVADINTEAEQLLPPRQPDGSGVGVNYADAFIKPLNTTLADGTTVACKRKGLRITIGIGDKTGDALLSLHNDGPDPKVILSRALERAAGKAGIGLSISPDGVYLEKM